MYGKYQGKNSGTEVQPWGEFAGEKYELRFLGYTYDGYAIQNPYFPSDVSSGRVFKSKHDFGTYWARRNYIKERWNMAISKQLFGNSSCHCSCRI